MRDGLPLDLVDDGVEGGLVARTGRVAVHGLAIHDQRDLDDVGVRRAPVVFVGELDDRVRPIVHEPRDVPELSLRVGADSLGDLDVLALDDGSHASPPEGPSARPRV